MRERATAMHQRVIARLSREPVTRADIDLVANALHIALAPRDAALADDHDVDLLHPARTALILIDDVMVSDATLLAAGVLLESERNDLAREVRVEDFDAHAGRVVEILRAIPTPLTTDPGDLLEALIGLPTDFLAVALAERLDHARHLHLRSRSVWEARYAVERDVYLPVAVRFGGLMGRRYERWHRAFRARTGWP